MTSQFNKNPYQNGFTLIELSIVLVITSLMLVGAIQAFQIYTEKQKVERMNLLMISVNQAISNFPSRINPTTNAPYGRLPCPAPMNGAAAGNSYNSENCGITPVGGVLIGKIPTATLGLSSEMMRDIHEHYLIYAVTEVITNPATYNDPGAIEVVDEGDDHHAPPVTISDVKYVVVSTGSSGEGAYAFDGSQPIPCPIGVSKEAANCDGDEKFLSALQSDLSDSNFYDDRINFVSVLTAAPVTLGLPPTCSGSNKALQFDGTDWQCEDVVGGGSIDLYGRQQCATAGNVVIESQGGGYRCQSRR